MTNFQSESKKTTEIGNKNEETLVGQQKIHEEIQEEQTEKKENIYQVLDWFTVLGNNFYAVEGASNHIIYNSLKWEPFLLDKEVFQRIISQQLTMVDKNLLKEMWYIVDTISSNSREEYITHIQKHINEYKGPKVLDLSISEACNLNCHMCIHSYARQKANPRSETKIMNFETAKIRIDYYMDYMAKEFAEENLTFHFGSAEPLLNKKVLVQSLEYIKEKNIENKDMDISLNTNLTLLNDDISKNLAQYNIRVNIWLDGNKEQNDKIRLDHRNNGTHDIIVENVKKIREKGFNVGINLTLTDRNFNEVQPGEFIQLMKKLNVESMLVDIDFIQGVQNDPKEVVQKLLEFQKIGDREGIQVVGNWKAPFLNVTTEKRDEMVAFCHASKGKNLAVTPSQKLTFCTYTSQILVNNEAADIKTKFAFFVENMKNYMEEKNIHNACFQCAIEWLCNGWCHVTHEQKVAVEYMCKIYKEATKELLKYYFGDENVNSEEEVRAPWA